jgi:diguanylate cyclase (GGDEF)-like protein
VDKQRTARPAAIRGQPCDDPGEGASHQSIGSPPLRLLIVAEEREIAQRVGIMLELGGCPSQISWLADVSDALALLRYGRLDMGLIHTGIGQRACEQLIGRARRSGFHGPLVVLSPQDDEQVDQGVMEAGAHGFLVERDLRPELLVRTLRYALCMQERIFALQELARRDPLTALLNLRSFEELLEAAVARARRQPASLALLYVDLDGFKKVNDGYGHEVGNQLLVQIASRLHRRLRRGDTLARVGGDEFAVILESLPEGFETAAQVAEALIETVREPLEHGDRWLSVGASVGIALCPADAAAPKPLMQCADSAMYAAKDAGGDAWRRYEHQPGGVTGRWPSVRSRG